MSSREGDAPATGKLAGELRDRVRRVLVGEVQRIADCAQDDVANVVAAAGFELALVARVLPGWLDEEVAGASVGDAAGEREVARPVAVALFHLGWSKGVKQLGVIMDAEVKPSRGHGRSRPGDVAPLRIDPHLDPNPASRLVAGRESLQVAYKIDEAAAVAKIGRTSLYKAIKRGELTARKAGRLTIILRSDLEEWLESLPASRPPVDRTPT